MNDPDFKKTKKTIIKQVVGIRLALDVVEYHADVYYNSKIGERVHALFPDGVVNDVNYDGSVKAFLFLLKKAGRVIPEFRKHRLPLSKHEHAVYDAKK